MPGIKNIWFESLTKNIKNTYDIEKNVADQDPHN